MATATTAARPGADARTLVASYWTARRAAAVVVLVGFVVRFWVLASGWFSGTDHVLRIRAWESSFDLAYLSATGVPGSSPGMAAVQWPLSRLWPLDFTPLVLLLLALQCAVLLLVAVLVRQLWGDRWLGLVPLTIVAVAPVGLVAAAWWSVGLPTSLVQLATAGLLVAGVSWWRGGAAWGLLVAAAVWIIAVPFGDLALVAGPLALVVVPSLAGPGARSRRLWWTVLAGTTAAASGLLAVRLLWLGAAVPPPGAPEVWSQSVGRAVTDGLAALLGGPLQWDVAGPETAAAATPLWWTVLTVQAVLLLVVCGSAVSPRAMLVWIWAGVWLLLTTGLLILSIDGASVAPLAARTLRYTGAAAVPLALAVGTSLALLAAPTRAAATRLLGRRARRWFAGPLAAVLAAVVVMTASIVSLSGFRTVWSANASRVFTDGALVALAGQPRDEPLIDQAVPPQVLTPLLAPYHLTSQFFDSVEARPPVGQVATSLRVWAPDGTLRQGIVQGERNRPGPVPGCGWLLRGSGPVPLQNPVPAFVHTVRLTYFANADTTADLQVGDGAPVRVPVVKGLGEIVAVAQGGGDRVRLTGMAPGTLLCTDDVAVGVPVVAP